MPIVERDVVLQGVDEDGNPTIDMPVTRLGNVEDTAEIKAAPEDGDYIPVIDSKDNGEMKKVPWAVMRQRSNPNLLDNWYFADPINQRGKTEYTGNRYTIDRWWIYIGTCSLLADGVQITFGSPYSVFRQKIESNLLGETVTVSSIVDGELYCKTGIIGEGANQSVKANISNNMYFRTYKDASSNCTIFEFVIDANELHTISAAKLELGPVQTLAHKEGDTWVLNDPPPNKALELAKCQRYQLVLNANSGFLGNGVFINDAVAFLCIPTPVSMRATPTVSYSGVYANTNGHFASGAIPVIDIQNPRLNQNNINLDIKIAALQGLTGQAMYLQNRGAGSYLIFDANL